MWFKNKTTKQNKTNKNIFCVFIANGLGFYHLGVRWVRVGYATFGLERKNPPTFRIVLD